MEKKNKRIVIIAVIAAVVVIAAAIGVAAWYNAPTQRISRMLNLGQEYLLAEDYENAIATFDGILAIDPNNSLALQGRVDAYLSWADKVYADGTGDEATAIAILEEGIAKTADADLEERLAEIAGSQNNNSVNSKDDSRTAIGDDSRRSHSQMYMGIVELANTMVLDRKLNDWTFDDLYEYVQAGEQEEVEIIDDRGNLLTTTEYLFPLTGNRTFEWQKADNGYMYEEGNKKVIVYGGGDYCLEIEKESDGNEEIFLGTIDTYETSICEILNYTVADFLEQYDDKEPYDVKVSSGSCVVEVNDSRIVLDFYEEEVYAIRIYKYN